MRNVRLSSQRVAQLEQLHSPSLLDAAKALLLRIDHMTTEDFRCGGERVEREALRLAINREMEAAHEC